MRQFYLSAVIGLAAFFLLSLPHQAAAQDDGGLLAPDPSRSAITSSRTPSRLKAPAPSYNEGVSAASRPDIILREDRRNKKESILTTIQKLPPEIQEELLAESAEAQNECTRDAFYSTYYDCSCFGLTYLEARYNNPEQTSMGNLIFDMDVSGCVFQPAIAGETYNRCQNYTEGVYPPEQGKKLCQCISRGVARDFAKNPVPNIKHTRRLYKLNRDRCENTL